MATAQANQDPAPGNSSSPSASSDINDVTNVTTQQPGSSVNAAPQNKPKRFYGAVELDMVLPVKAFETVLNAVVLELQRTLGAKVRITLEIAAEADMGFEETDVGVVRDNTKQLRFTASSTAFE